MAAFSNQLQLKTTVSKLKIPDIFYSQQINIPDLKQEGES